VVRIDPAGNILSTTPTLAVARAITAASAAPVAWFTQAPNGGVGQIGRLQYPTLQQFAVPTTGELVDIAEGSDGGIWFTDTGGNRIARLPPGGGALSSYPLPTAAAFPHGITSGPDGNVWFTMRDANKIGVSTTDGDITEICIPTAASGPTSIAAGPDGNIWFTETAANKIGRVSLTVMAASDEPVEVASSDPAESDSGCAVRRPSSSNAAALGWILGLGLLAGARRRSTKRARPS
jgi:streptogramin lyase